MNSNFYSDFYEQTSPMLNGTNTGDSTWLIVSAVMAIVGGIAVYFLFISKKNEGTYKGFTNWLHEFLNFKSFFIDAILKALYIILAIYITLGSFSYIGNNISMFFLQLILGNILARIGFEMVLMMITLVNNTTEINRKLTKTKVTGDKNTIKSLEKTESEKSEKNDTEKNN